MTWLLGIRPGHRGLPPLYPTGGRTSAADRLRIMLGLTVEEFVATFPVRANVFNSRMGSMIARVVTGRAFVLGREAWVGLGLPGDHEFWASVRRGRATYTLLPHPSGRCRIYNIEKNRARLRRIIRRSNNQYAKLAAPPA